MTVKFYTETVLRTIDKSTKPMRKMALEAQKLKRQFRGVEKAAKSIGRAGANMSLKFTAPTAAGFLGITQQAAQFEDAMAGVAKQLPDDAGANGLSIITDQIRALSETSNQTPTQIAAIAEEAGKAAIPFKDWAKFIDLTSRSAVALDMEAGEAAETLLGIGAGLGIRDNLPALRQFAADSNLVADSAKATAPQLLDYAQRVSGVARIAGASSDAILAIGGAFIDTGVEAEIAARASSKMFTVFGTNEGVTKRAQTAFSKLRLPKNFVDQFRKDAPKALQLFSDKLSGLDEKAQLGTLKNIFGEDQAKNIARLLGNTEKLSTLIAKVGDKGKSSLKFDEEYQRQLATFNSQWQVLKNSVSNFAIETGNTLLPMLKDMFEQIKPVIKSAVEWMKANKELMPTILKVVAGVALLGPLLSVISSTAMSLFFLTQTGILLAPAFVKLAPIFTGLAGALKFLAVGGIAIAKAGLVALGAVIMANPITAIVSAIGLAGIAFFKFVDQPMEKIIGAFKLLKKVVMTVLWPIRMIMKLIGKGVGAILPKGFKEDLKLAMGMDVDVNSQSSQRVGRKRERIQPVQDKIQVEVISKVEGQVSKTSSSVRRKSRGRSNVGRVGVTAA